VYASVPGYAEYLADADANRERVLRLLPTCRWLHFSGHGHFDSHRPQLSRLDLAPGEDLTIEDVTGVATSTACVVLAACQTHRTHVDEGDDLVGIGQTFLSSGVRCVIGTLWSVTDGETAIILESFYKHLMRPNGTRQTSVADALHRALAEVVPAWDMFLADWAGLVVIGNW
jgi:CHAT domain-containing protein